MSVTAAQGFVAAGTAGGVKGDGAADLAVVATADGAPVAAAAVTTSNEMTAAPVQVTLEHLTATGGMASAVVLNSGNANAGTGEPGRIDAREMCALTAKALGCDAREVLVCSTGLIGYRLPMDALRSGIPAAAVACSPDGGPRAAHAILTTDTVAKQSVHRAGPAVVGGMAKGAAMLRPDMATMLAVITTDAQIEPEPLTTALRTAVSGSFNALSVDGAQSTNDTVIVLAGGLAGPVDTDEFTTALGAVCGDLALAMCDDAEGSTKTVRLTVTGAATEAEAEQAARRIGESQLVKCSWYGKDPYWGRLASEAGSAGVTFDQSRIAVSYGAIEVARGGVSLELDAETQAALTTYMDQRHIEPTVDLGVGDASWTLLTNDLTHAYVDENMGTS